MLLQTFIVFALVLAIAKIWSLDRKVQELSEKLDIRSRPLLAGPPASPPLSDVVRPAAVPDARPGTPGNVREPSRLEVLGREAAAEEKAVGNANALRNPEPAGTVVPAAREIGFSHGPGESMMARWPVWLGGVCLLLAGFFLVQYSIDNFSLSIGARVAAGLAFGATLVLAGEALKGRSIGESFLGNHASNVPATLSGSGVSALFAAFWASYGYAVLPAAVSFTGMAATGFLAIALSLRHGWWLAGAGMAAAYAPPLLMMEDMPVPYLGLLAYLLLVCATVLAASVRFGGMMALIGVAGAMAIPLAWVVKEGFDIPGDGGAIMAYAAIVLGMTMARAAVSPAKGALGIGIDFAFLWVMIPVLAGNGADWTTVFFTILFTTATALACRILPGIGFNGFVTSLKAGKLPLDELYGASGFLALAIILAGEASAYVSPPLPVAISLFIIVAGGALLGLRAKGGALFMLASAFALVLVGVWCGPVLTGVLSAAFLAIFATALIQETLLSRAVNGRSLQIAALAFMAAVIPAACVILHVLGNVSIDMFSGKPAGPGYGLMALVFAVSLLGLSEAVSRSCLTGKLRWTPAGLFDGSAIALTGAMVLVSAERGQFAAALALSGLVLSLPALRRSAIVLRHAPAVLGGAALVALSIDPTVVGTEALYRHPWSAATMAASYLAVFAALSIASVMLGRRLKDRALRLAQALATVSAFVAFIALLRYAVHGPAMASGAPGLLEQAAYAVFSLGASYVLCFLGLKERSPVFKAASLAAGFWGMASAAFTLGWGWNPAFNRQAIEAGPIVLSLAAGYLVPGALAAAIAASAAGRRFGLPAMPGQPRQYVLGMAGLAGFLLFWWATLMTRHAFVGADMAALHVGQAEMLAYSAVWLAMGGGILLAGIFLGDRFLRIASAPVVTLVIAKVFLVDMSSLEGLYRAFSFMGLGVSMIAVGIFYQRMLSREPS